MTRRLLAWLSLVILVSAPIALADDEDNDTDDDHGEVDEGEGDERTLKLDVDGLSATIKLEREQGDLEDSVKIEYDAENAKVQVKHEENDGQNESEMKLEARFLALVEFVDADADGAYDVTETIASAWALGDEKKDAKIPTNGTVAWSDIVVSEVTSGNASGKKLSSRASFGPNATFGLDFFVYGDFTLVGNHSLAPTQTKIDIIIEHYPYARSDTALAVIVDLKAKEEIESDDEDEAEDEEGVFSEMSSGNLTFRLTFTWLETATVDGVERAVHSTVIKSKEEAEDGEIEQKSRVALSYARGDIIVHDPTLGATYETASTSARGVPFPPLALIIGVAVLAALTRRVR